MSFKTREREIKARRELRKKVESRLPRADQSIKGCAALALE
jgi:hypothetical protein